jgi:hypothetical protein
LIITISPKLTNSVNASFANRDTLRVTADAVGADGLPKQVVIDAESGEVLLDELSSHYPAEVTTLLGSITRETMLPEVWPFVDEPPPNSRREFGQTSYPIPSPASGVRVSHITGLCTEAPCVAEIIQLNLSPSAYAQIDAENGELLTG